MQLPSIRRVGVIGNYLPRQCGIATFTTHLCEAMASEFPDLDVFAIPVNDQEEGYSYPDRVRFELDEQELTSYQRAAEFLNMSNVDLICVQHEFGIFGGAYGEDILDLLQGVHAPIVTTLHTILRDPRPEQRQILRELTDYSDRFVVMSRRGKDFLQEIYEIPEHKIQVVPHGVPDMPFIDPNYYKDQFDAEGKIVLMTFGLLSASKGIEYVISALPIILESYPNVLYIVLGTTHPHVKRTQGEEYRERLQALARDLGVEEHVQFRDEFVSQESLLRYIAATDIYLTPYLQAEQIVSGALAYTIGAGKAIVSTPYWYAEELLADGRGGFVPFRDAEAIATRVCDLLGNDIERNAMRKRAYLYGRQMIWPQVAQNYMHLFQQVRAERFVIPRAMQEAPVLPRISPAITFEHIRRLTDDTGILQHAIFALPNYHAGYDTDDNARALIAAILAETLHIAGCEDSHILGMRYLAFLWHAYNENTGRFRNFMGYDRTWLEEEGSEDSHGRSLHALGTVLHYSLDPDFQGVATLLFRSALPSSGTFHYPRAWAFTLLGIHGYLQRFAGDSVAQRQREALAEQLLALYHEHHTDDWQWFEPELTYDNAALAHALLVTGYAMHREEMISAALTALDWLTRIQEPEATHFAPIGSNGFYPKDGVRARFDQQPVEAYSTISACLDAYRLTGNDRWHEKAQTALKWFYGQNDLHLPLFNAFTGGCNDGLQPDRINQNQGAESSLAFLLSLLEFRLTQEGEASTMLKKQR